MPDYSEKWLTEHRRAWHPRLTTKGKPRWTTRELPLSELPCSPGPRGDTRQALGCARLRRRIAAKGYGVDPSIASSIARIPVRGRVMDDCFMRSARTRLS